MVYFLFIDVFESAFESIKASGMSCPELVAVFDVFPIRQNPQNVDGGESGPGIVSKDSMTFEILTVLPQKGEDDSSPGELVDGEAA